MPLTAEYTWAESETTIQLQVPLRGQSKSKVDVFATECYLKVSFPPYLLELDLDRCIDVATRHKARVEKGILVIKAKKKEGSTGIWGALGKRVDRQCAPDVKNRREESIKEHFKREEQLKERVSLRKHEDERLALRSQMSVEEAERRLIEDIKADEKEKAEADVYRTFEELAAKRSREEQPAAPPAAAQPKQEQSGARRLLLPSTPLPSITSDQKTRRVLDTIPEEISAEEGRPVHAVSGPAASGAKVDMAIGDDTNSNDGGDGVSDHDSEGGEPTSSPKDDAHANTSAAAGIADDDGETVSYVPSPRVPIGVVPVGFTTRLFPTPLRESKVAGESEWIMKNRRHLHKNKTLVGRLPSSAESGADMPVDISESDPVWLKGRGDDLYRGGDFLAAINAYTAALDTDPAATACFSNRAACYLRLGKASACVADCSAALGILEKIPESGPSQGRALARRSRAYLELGHYRSSLEDCRAALQFVPGDAALETDITRLESLALCETAKKEAVVLFASGDIAGACDLYTAALAAVPTFPTCLSNRAACYLALGRPLECVRDCTAVLDLLSPGLSSGDDVLDASSKSLDNVQQGLSSPPTSTQELICPPGSTPPAGSEKRRQWVLTTVLRRGRANVELGHLDSALRDYRTASSLAPDDKSIEGDVRELERRENEAQTPLTH